MNREVVEKNKLFKGIESDSLNRMLVCSKAQYKKYERGETVFRQEMEAKVIYVLLSGRVAIVKHLLSGRKNMLYEVGSGDVFGEHYFFCGNRIYKYGAEAYTDVEVLEIPWQFLFGFCNEACKHHQQLVQNMLEILSMKEWLTIKKLNIVSTVSLTERIATWLLDEAEERDVVRLKLNREKLADYLGVARPSLSRALMRMQKEGMIEAGKNQIKIIDREKLENFSN